MVLAVALLAAGCGGEADGDLATVAKVDGHVVTVGDVKTYLAANLPRDLEGEPRDADRIRSRLFDALMDEEILLAEARRQGIEVSREEENRYLTGSDLDPVDGDPGPHERKIAQRSILARKLIGRTVLRSGDVSDEEIEAHLEAGAAGEGGGRSVVLRSLMLESKEQADRVYNNIRRRRQTFAEAVVAYEQTPGQAWPTEVPLETLPGEVAEAIRDLKAGRTTKPVTLHGDVYLFHVEEWLGPDEGWSEEARETARRELLRQRHEEATRTLMTGLKERIEVEIDRAALPFRYIEEDAG